MDFVKAIIKPFDRKSRPGAVPGTVVTKKDEPAPVIDVISYNKEECIEKKDVELPELQDFTGHSSVVWINVRGLGDAKVIKNIGETFNIHGLVLEDIVNVHQRAKVEYYDDHLFIVARMAGKNKKLYSKQISMFVGANYVLTFQEASHDDCLDPLRKRIRKSIGRIRERGTDYLTYALLDSIIDHYFPIVEYFGERLDDLDELLLANSSQGTITAIHSFQRELLILRKNLRPHRELLNELLKVPNKIISEETNIYLRDCYDHVIQLGDATNAYRETCSDLREYNLAMLSNRTNEVMKTLTIVSTLFIPLGFIAGLYGMNFKVMPELKWDYGYFFALGLMAITASSLLFWFRSKDWFD